MNNHAAHPPTGRELYLRFRNRGDREAFAALVHRFEGELYRYLRRYLRNAALAEDVFQATFMQIYQKAALYDEVRRFRPWLYSIATHLAVDTQGRTRTRGQPRRIDGQR
jgi:RNA polymerase sigma-70 factor (ECF subfamily)